MLHVTRGDHRGGFMMDGQFLLTGMRSFRRAMFGRRKSPVRTPCAEPQFIGYGPALMDSPTIQPPLVTSTAKTNPPST